MNKLINELSYSEKKVFLNTYLLYVESCKKLEGNRERVVPVSPECYFQNEYQTFFQKQSNVCGNSILHNNPNLSCNELKNLIEDDYNTVLHYYLELVKVCVEKQDIPISIFDFFELDLVA